MKKTIISALLLTAALASAADIGDVRKRHNAKLCKAVGLERSCTKEQFTAKVAELTEAKLSVPSETFLESNKQLEDIEMAKLIAKKTEESINVGAAIINKAFVSATADERVAMCAAVPRLIPDPEDCR